MDISMHGDLVKFWLCRKKPQPDYSILKLVSVNGASYPAALHLLFCVLPYTIARKFWTEPDHPKTPKQKDSDLYSQTSLRAVQYVLEENQKH